MGVVFSVLMAADGLCGRSLRRECELIRGAVEPEALRALFHARSSTSTLDQPSQRRTKTPLVAGDQHLVVYGPLSGNRR